MTASRALSGSAQVRPDKVKRVLDAAASLGYRRNENARSLRPGQRTGLVGVIITNASNPYYAEMQLGAEQVLAQHGMRVLVGNTGESVDRERQLVSDFVGWQVDGLIVVPTGGDTTHLAALGDWETPLVLASRVVEEIDADTVLIDDLGGTRAAVSTLLSEGHEGVAFLGHGMSVPTAARRLQGFVEAHEEVRRPVEPGLVFSGSVDPDEARRAAEELLGAPHPPSAVFCANNRNTLALMHALPLTGRKDRERLRVVAFDNFDTADLMPIHLSIVDHDAREMGRKAAELLVQRLEGESDGARRVELPTRFLP
jgi:LacI family transcriptional regulator